MIKKEGEKWVLYSHDGSKKLGTFDSEDAAKKRERQIQFFKHQGEVSEEPKKFITLEEMKTICPSCAEEMEKRSLTKVEEGVIKHVIKEQYKPPEGWNDPKSWLSSKQGAEEIRKKAWAGMGGSHHTCVAHMSEHVDDPDRFCAALKDAVLGTTKWRKGRHKKGEEVAEYPTSVFSFEALSDYQPESEFSIEEVYDQFEVLSANIMEATEEQVPDKALALKSLLSELDEKLPEVTDPPEDEDEDEDDEEEEEEEEDEPEAEESDPVKVSESFEGSLSILSESTPEPSALDIQVVLIKPGFGNTRDNHYYTKELLQKDSPKFVGAKMYETDHRPGEKSTRTWVSTITGLKGFTEEGAPIANVVVHDPSFAQRLVNLKDKGLLGKMECSIAAGALAEKESFTLDGRKGKKITQITSVESVDWVTKAGAGGHVLDIAEGTDGVENTETPEETPETVEEEEQGGGKPVELTGEQVKAVLQESQLPQISRDRLAGATYESEEALRSAIAKEIDYLKAVTKSGRPFQMGESTTVLEQVQARESDLSERLDDIDHRYGVNSN